MPQQTGSSSERRPEGGTDGAERMLALAPSLLFNRTTGTQRSAPLRQWRPGAEPTLVVCVEQMYSAQR